MTDRKQTLVVPMLVFRFANIRLDRITLDPHFVVAYNIHIVPGCPVGILNA